MKVEDQIRRSLESEAARQRGGDPMGAESVMRIGSRRRTRKYAAVSVLSTIGIVGFVWVASSIGQDPDVAGPSGTDAPVVSTTLPLDATTAPTPVETTVPTPETTVETVIPAGETVQVAFATPVVNDCSGVDFVDRVVEPGTDPILGAFTHLASGPTQAEMDEGLGSWFSEATEDAVISATLTDGLLVVDFNDIRPHMGGASTSCGSASLIAQLNATAFQFPEVQRVSYTIDGNCDTFFNWLQGECQTFER